MILDEGKRNCDRYGICVISGSVGGRLYAMGGQDENEG